MLVHCSVELLKAMCGEGGRSVSDHALVDPDSHVVACNFTLVGITALKAYAWHVDYFVRDRNGNPTTRPDFRPVTCRRCLRLMFEAIHPVRRDQLLELGILTPPERVM